MHQTTRGCALRNVEQAVRTNAPSLTPAPTARGDENGRTDLAAGHAPGRLVRGSRPRLRPSLGCLVVLVLRCACFAGKSSSSTAASRSPKRTSSGYASRRARFSSKKRTYRSSTRPSRCVLACSPLSRVILSTGISPRWTRTVILELKSEQRPRTCLVIVRITLRPLQGFWCCSWTPSK